VENYKAGILPGYPRFLFINDATGFFEGKCIVPAINRMSYRLRVVYLNDATIDNSMFYSAVNAAGA